jgi:hypothetical protein
MIVPGLTTPAFRLGVGGNLNAACNPTFLFNWIDFPAGCVPVTCVTDEDLATPRQATESIGKRIADVVCSAISL